MAIFPCDLGRHSYPGPQQTMYAAVVNGGDSSRRKLRLCPSHFDHRLQALTDSYRDAQAAFDDPLLLACPVCGDLVEDSRVQCFVTAYRRGDERRDFWAPVHEHCREAAQSDWLIEPGMP